MIVWTSWLFVALICSFAALIAQKSRWTTDLPWLYLSWIGSPFLKLARDWKRFSTLSPLFHWNLLSFAAIMFLRKQTVWEDSFQNPRWSLSPDNQFLVQYCLVWTFCIESCWGGCLTVERVRTVYWSNEPSLGSLWRLKMWGLLVKPSQVSQSLYSFFMDWESLKCSPNSWLQMDKSPFFKNITSKFRWMWHSKTIGGLNCQKCMSTEIAGLHYLEAQLGFTYLSNLVWHFFTQTLQHFLVFLFLFFFGS